MCQIVFSNCNHRVRVTGHLNNLSISACSACEACPKQRWGSRGDCARASQVRRRVRLHSQTVPEEGSTRCSTFHGTLHFGTSRENSLFPLLPQELLHVLCIPVMMSHLTRLYIQSRLEMFFSAFLYPKWLITLTSSSSLIPPLPLPSRLLK